MTGFTKKFIQTFNKITSLRIQGAENITHEGSKATLHQILKDIERIPEENYTMQSFRLIKDKATSKMLSSRPTEPHLHNSLSIALGSSIPRTKEEALLRIKKGLIFIEDHHKNIHSQISKVSKEQLSNYTSVYTHCHSSLVERCIIDSKIKIVYNTETRPRYQGRITAKKLAGNSIVHHYVDSGANIAIQKADVILLGADSITMRGDVINKIGSGIISILCSYHKKPLYIIADTLKLDLNSQLKDTTIEERSHKEVWNVIIPGLYVNNPAFETIKSELITGIICEKGIYSSKQYVRIAQKEIERLSK
jgi:ribose 1,5-bisphosphate isomerase